MTDVLILYEHRNREIENCGLLSEELSYRGYKVKIESIFSPWKYFMRPKVLIVPHLYNEDQLIRFAKNIWLSNSKILSMQYEQVLSKGSWDSVEDLHRPSGQAKFAHHISWGESQTHRYLEAGIQKENIHETGFISMDLLRKELAGYLKNKEELSSEFDMDFQKEWVLFISSFALANRTKEEIAEFEKLNPLSPLFAEVTNASYPIIIDWLKRLAVIFPNKIFIYRPHPAEKLDVILKRIESECPNFRCIEKYTMRQWAHVVDLALNWISTSVTDLYFAKKPCFLLRPVEIPEVLDMDILNDVSQLHDFDDVVSVLNSDSATDEMGNNPTIEFYYGKNEGRMAFLKIADICEKMMNGEIDGYPFNYGRSRFNLANSHGLKTVIWEYLKMLLFLICNTFKIQKVPFISAKHLRKLYRYKRDVYDIDHDITYYCKRFNPIVRKIHAI